MPGKGAIDLPNYFARQLVIESGLLKFSYDNANPVLVLEGFDDRRKRRVFYLTGSFIPLRGTGRKIESRTGFRY